MAEYDFAKLMEEDRDQAIRSVVGITPEDDPERAGRAVELGTVTGVAPEAIYPNVKEFEVQHKAALNSDLITGNPHLQGYLNSSPMAAKLSQDDIAQLDASIEQAKSMPDQTVFSKVRDALGIRAVGEAAFPPDQDPFAGLKELQKSRPADLQFKKDNPQLYQELKDAHDIIGVPIVLGSELLKGLTNIAKHFSGERDIAGMLEYEIIKGEGVGIGKTMETLKPLPNTLKVLAPYLKAGVEPPVGIDPLIDKAHIEDAKKGSESLAEAVRIAQESATRERSPEHYAEAMRQVVGDRNVEISIDAIKELYGDKIPEVGDNLLGWIPNLAERMQSADFIGDRIQVPMADWLANIDPDIHKQLKDHIATRDGGLTPDEAKTLEPAPKAAEDDLASRMDKIHEERNALEATGVVSEENLPLHRAIATTDAFGVDPVQAMEAARWAMENGRTDIAQVLVDRAAKRAAEPLNEPNLPPEHARYQTAKDMMQKSHDINLAHLEDIKQATGLEPTPIKREPTGPIPEPLQLIRGSAGLEPMFSVGDRKVTLQRAGEGRKSYPEAENSPVFHDFDLIDQNGKPLGSLNLSEQKDGKQIYIEMINAGPREKKFYDPNFLGPSLIRDIARQLKQEFPKAFGPDGLGITGHRVSGAREKAGTWEEKHAFVNVKFSTYV